MTRRSSRPAASYSQWGIFRWPIVIGSATVIGLLSALIGDGWADALSWVLLGALIAVMVIAWTRD